jgi:hypothetical protein
MLVLVKLIDLMQCQIKSEPFIYLFGDEIELRASYKHYHWAMPPSLLFKGVFL